MSFQSNLKARIEEYTEFSVYGKKIQLPYFISDTEAEPPVYGGKNTPAQIRSYIMSGLPESSTKAQIETFVNDIKNKPKTGIDCSGFAYYTVNEASGGALMAVFGSSYANGVKASTLTSTAYGAKCTKAADIIPGCLMRSDRGGHVLVVYGVSYGADGRVNRIDYAHSNGSKGPHLGYITVGDPNSDLKASSQTWYDIAYNDAQARSLYDYTIRLDCLSGGVEPIDEIPVNANLTVQGTDVNVRTNPSTSASIVKKLSTGASIQATGRVLIDGEPWFHISAGWINGAFVQGWVKDYNDNNRWWYVERGYSYPVSTWMTINGKDYCFGKDGYLFVECYIKSEDKEKYYWVDDDGVYMQQYDTDVPDAGYRVVYNYKTENAYQG